MEENVDDLFSNLTEISPDPPEKRATCVKCSRPRTACWCPFLPREPIIVNTRITILQHPFEESRRLKTAPMIELGLAQGQCHIIKGKRFGMKKYPGLHSLVKDPNTLLLYPGPQAVNLSTVVTPGDHKGYNLILLDGTWMQARGIFCQNAFLQQLKQVKLEQSNLSEYVIRTQPNDSSLSTLETAAYSIALLEKRPDIIEPLLRPLKALCDIQIQHGALRHHSRQFLIDNGLYKKQQNTPAQKHTDELVGPPTCHGPATQDGDHAVNPPRSIKSDTNHQCDHDVALDTNNPQLTEQCSSGGKNAENT